MCYRSCLDLYYIVIVAHRYTHARAFMHALGIVNCTHAHVRRGVSFSMPFHSIAESHPTGTVVSSFCHLFIIMIPLTSAYFQIHLLKNHRSLSFATNHLHVQMCETIVALRAVTIPNGP